MRRLVALTIFVCLTPTAMASSVTYLLTGTVTGANGDPIRLPFSVAPGDPISVVITVAQTATGGPGSANSAAQYTNATGTTDDWDVVEAMTFYVGGTAIDIGGVGLTGDLIAISDNEATGTPGQFEDDYVANMLGYIVRPVVVLPFAPFVAYSGRIELTQVDASPQAFSSSSYVPFPSNWAQFPVKRLTLTANQSPFPTHFDITGDFTSVVQLPGPLSPLGSALTVAQSQAGGSLVTNAGADTWTFGPASNAYGNDVLLNGGGTGGSATLLRLVLGGQVYAQAGDGSWWLWNNSGWSSSSPLESPDGYRLTPAQSRAGDFIGALGGRYTFGTASHADGFVLLVNGVETGSYFTLLEVANGGQLYAQASDGSWYSQFFVYGDLFTWRPSSPPTPISPDASTLTVAQSQSGATLTTSAGAWNFGATSNAYGNAVLLDGGVTGYATLLEVANGGQLYAEASDTSWWRWNNPGFSRSTAPAGALSPDGSTLTVPQSQAGGSVITGDGTWTFGAVRSAYGNEILLNGGATLLDGYATLLEIADGLLYAQAGDGSWWLWSNPRWLSSPAPSLDGATLTFAQSQAGGSIVTSAGTWTFGTANDGYGNAILLNGGGTDGWATLLLLSRTQIYAQAGDGSWWRWLNPGWSYSAGPE
jgi:hypothetical protein